MQKSAPAEAAEIPELYGKTDLLGDDFHLYLAVRNFTERIRTGSSDERKPQRQYPPHPPQGLRPEIRPAPFSGKCRRIQKTAELLLRKSAANLRSREKKTGKISSWKNLSKAIRWVFSCRILYSPKKRRGRSSCRSAALYGLSILWALFTGM